MFNPRFSNVYLLNYISDIVEEISIFCETLRHHARQRDLVQLDIITV